MRKELSLGLALYALIIQTTPAAQPFQLYSCVEEELYPILERFNDANEELELREGRLRDIDEKIAAIDKEYPFLPKADSLRISYYEEKEYHPEIKGLCVPVHVRKCSVEIKGTKPKDLAKAKGMELSSTSGIWQLFFR